MRVLLTPVGSTGDNLPFIGVGAELVRRGHDVTCATSEHFAVPVRHSGMAFLPTSTEAEYRAATDDPDLFDPRRGFAAVMAVLAQYERRLFEIVRTQQAAGPLTVVAHSLDFASHAIAEKTGLGVVRMHLQPTVIRTSYRVPIMRGTVDYSFLPPWIKRALWALVDRKMLDPAIAPTVNELRRRLGLAPARRIFATQMNSPLLTLAMFPDWFAPPQPVGPPNLELCVFPICDAPAPARLPAEVERFLGPPEQWGRVAQSPSSEKPRQGRASDWRPIVFTPGSAMRYGQAFFAAGLEACAALGRRALLLTRHAEQVPQPLPYGAVRFDYAPLRAALPRCAAIVHHGGIGTTAAGLAAGVPQVVVPFSHDQPDNAARVERLGVGRRIMPRDLDAGRLAGVLDELLASDDVARRSADVAARCAADSGIERACDLIENVRKR